MKLALWKAVRILAVPFGYLLCGLIIVMIVLASAFNIVPLLVSLLITYLGFTEDATLAVIILMGGVPCAFLAGLVGYGVIRLLNAMCVSVMSTFRSARAGAIAKIAKESGERL